MKPVNKTPNETTKINYLTNYEGFPTNPINSLKICQLQFFKLRQICYRMSFFFLGNCNKIAKEIRLIYKFNFLLPSFLFDRSLSLMSEIFARDLSLTPNRFLFLSVSSDLLFFLAEANFLPCQRRSSSSFSQPLQINSLSSSNSLIGSTHSLT